MMGYEGPIVNRTIEVKLLPNGIRIQVARVGHHRPVIQIQARSRTSIASCAGQGARGFAVMLADVNSPAEAFYGHGSWGGSNAFTPPNPIDGGPEGFSDRDVPEGGAWICGTESDRHTSACVVVTPLTMARIVAPDHAATLIAGDAIEQGNVAPETIAALAGEALLQRGPDPLTFDERRVLFAFGAIKSGDYRKNMLAEIANGEPSWRSNPKAGLGTDGLAALIESLITRGYLKRASNGAMSMTTAGKVLRGPVGGHEVW